MSSPLHSNCRIETFGKCKINKRVIIIIPVLIPSPFISYWTQSSLRDSPPTHKPIQRNSCKPQQNPHQGPPSLLRVSPSIYQATHYTDHCHFPSSHNHEWTFKYSICPFGHKSHSIEFAHQQIGIVPTEIVSCCALPSLSTNTRFAVVVPVHFRLDDFIKDDRMRLKLKYKLCSHSSF